MQYDDDKSIEVVIQMLPKPQHHRLIMRSTDTVDQVTANIAQTHPHLGLLASEMRLIHAGKLLVDNAPITVRHGDLIVVLKRHKTTKQRKRRGQSKLPVVPLVVPECQSEVKSGYYYYYYYYYNNHIVKIAYNVVMFLYSVPCELHELLHSLGDFTSLEIDHALRTSHNDVSIAADYLFGVRSIPSAPVAPVVSPAESKAVALMQSLCPQVSHDLALTVFHAAGHDEAKACDDLITLLYTAHI